MGKTNKVSCKSFGNICLELRENNKEVQVLNNEKVKWKTKNESYCGGDSKENKGSGGDPITKLTEKQVDSSKSYL